jgi:hypothetical protein
MSTADESDERDERDERDDTKPKPGAEAEEEAKGDPPPGDAGAPQTLSILFLAAAAGLVLLLGIIALLAFAAMSK